MDINNMELLNDSGLSSLSGFSYQIKVFILRLTQLQQGQRVEFETLDDVAVRSLSSKDSISDAYLVNPIISLTVDLDKSISFKNYYTGSMARHTLMQLCGYLGFLRMLIKEDKYPLIPFLVIDHISKPFDDKNQKALGAILHGAYTNLQKSEMQIILFDDEDASSLGLTPDHSINLLGEDKSGFNPFYMPSKEDSPNAPEEVE